MHLARCFAAFALLAAGCGFPKTTSSPPPAVASTDPQVATGRELFVANCNKCHGYPDLTTVEEAGLPDTIRRMGKKAKLDEKQTDDVLHFAIASRAAQTGTKPIAPTTQPTPLPPAPAVKE